MFHVISRSGEGSQLSCREMSSFNLIGNNVSVVLNGQIMKVLITEALCVTISSLLMY